MSRYGKLARSTSKAAELRSDAKSSSSFDDSFDGEHASSREAPVIAYGKRKGLNTSFWACSDLNAAVEGSGRNPIKAEPQEQVQAYGAKRRAIASVPPVKEKTAKVSADHFTGFPLICVSIRPCSFQATVEKTWTSCSTCWMVSSRNKP